MERGEVDIVGAVWAARHSRQPSGLGASNGEAVILYQASLKRHKLLPNVPTLPELAPDEEGREVLHAAAATGDIGRSILPTPGVPADTACGCCASAFQAMLRRIRNS